MSIMFFESFLGRNFGKIPKAVRVFTYISVLLVFLYNFLLPEFINGEIRIEEGSGEFIYYTLGQVSITVEGKDIITDTNDRGKWSLPLLNKIPKEQTIAFWYRGENRNLKTFEISFKGIDLIRGKHLVVYHNPDSSPKFYVKQEIPTTKLLQGHLNRLSLASIIDLFSVSATYAQNSTDSNNNQFTETEKQVIGVISQTVPNQRLELNKNSNLFKDVKISGKDEILLKRNIESKFKIQLDSRQWNNIATIGDLTKVVQEKLKDASLQLSDEIGYAYYGIQQSDGKWSERYFNNESRMKDKRPEVGDKVIATGNVNIRAGYIEFKLFRGWRNKEISGLIKANNRVFVEEVKTVAGNFVWIKFRRILD